MDKVNVLVTARLGDYKLATHIMGLIDSEQVEKIFLVRRQPLTRFSKIHNISPTGFSARSAFAFEIWRFFAVLRLIRAGRVNLLVGIQLQLHGVQAALAGWLTGVPVVLALIGSDVHIHLLNPWKRLFLKWALGRATAITVMGPRSRQRLIEAGVNRVRTVEMQVYQDDARFLPGEAQIRWDLLFVGRLIPLKRVHTLLAAVAKAKSDLPNIRVGILGDGPERGRLQELARSLDIAGNVEFIGYDSEVERYLRASRAFVLASESEGLPSAAIEAMFCGLPVILSDVGDVRGVFIPDHNALLVPKGDDQVLAKAIVRLLKDDRLYECLRNGALDTRDRHAAKWSRAGCVREWEKVMQYSLLNDRR